MQPPSKFLLTLKFFVLFCRSQCIMSVSKRALSKLLGSSNNTIDTRRVIPLYTKVVLVILILLWIENSGHFFRLRRAYLTDLPALSATFSKNPYEVFICMIKVGIV